MDVKARGGACARVGHGEGEVGGEGWSHQCPRWPARCTRAGSLVLLCPHPSSSSGSPGYQGRLRVQAGRSRRNVRDAGPRFQTRQRPPEHHNDRQGAAPGRRLEKRGIQSGLQGPDCSDRGRDPESQATYYNPGSRHLPLPKHFLQELGPEQEGISSGCRAEGLGSVSGLWLVQETRP